MRKNAADLPHSGASPPLAAFGPLIHWIHFHHILGCADFQEFTFCLQENGKYRQQFDFKYFNNRQCKNITIYGCKRKKLGLHLLKVMAALTWTVTGTTLNPKGEPLWGNTREDSHSRYLQYRQRLGKKLCPCQIKNYSRRGCILSWFNPTHLITMLDQYPLKNAKPTNHCTHTLLRCADWFSSLPMTISWIFLG